MRLDKFLANSGVGTRTEVKKALKKGQVLVDEKLIKDASFDVTTDNVILYNNKKIEYKPNVYIMLNKPSGYLSASFDKKQKTVIDLLENKFYTYKLFPVGRLDIDTEGLLILTNDGKLSHELLSPKKHIKKTYYVELLNNIEEDYQEKFQSGLKIDDYICKKDAIIDKLTDKTCNLTITEGKFHQVKKMFEALGNKVLYLKRIKMNKLLLDENLKKGQFKELSLDELNMLKDGL